MKKRTIVLFTIIPFISGFLFAAFRGLPSSKEIMFYAENVLPTDKITLCNNGDIYQLTKQSSKQITHNQHLIEPVAIGNTIVAVSKTTNYASLVMYDKSGNKIKTLFNGNSGNIDAMNWISDPAVNSEKNILVYVSDKDKQQTNIPDNALYAMNLSDGKSTNIANPDPYSGGIAHPVSNPANSNIFLYDYYQYDSQSLTPYSTIEQYDKQTGTITTVTFEKLNAYQESFSLDGKQLLFLGRNDGLNTVTLYIADINGSGIFNTHAILTGDIAYPAFSNTKNHIYYLQSEGNKGYNLLSATVQKNKLMNLLPITNGFQLPGNSSYNVTQNTSY